MHKLTLKLDNLDERDGAVMVLLLGPNASVFARSEQTFCGDTWETDGNDFAYCLPMDALDLLKEAKKLCTKHTGITDWQDPFDEKEYSFSVELDASEYAYDD